MTGPKSDSERNYVIHGRGGALDARQIAGAASSLCDIRITSVLMPSSQDSSEGLPSQRPSTLLRSVIP